MGCGLIAQRGPSVEVHHPIARDPSGRAAGARVVVRNDGHANSSPGAASSGSQGSQGNLEPRGRAVVPSGVRNSGGNGGGGVGADAGGSAHSGSSSGRSGAGAEGQQHGAQFARNGPGRRFIMGERVVVASRLPAYIQDQAFCFECGSFFQLGTARTPACSRCGSSFVQFLRPPGFENWISPESASGISFSFDDQLQDSTTASLEETPAVRRPTQSAFLRSLPMLQLSETEIKAREQLDPRDPKRGCAICREDFVVDTQVKRLPCAHEFHDSCIVAWLQANNTCPICRSQLPEAADDEQDEADGEDLQLKRGSVPTEATPGGTTTANPGAMGSALDTAVPVRSPLPVAGPCR